MIRMNFRGFTPEGFPHLDSLFPKFPDMGGSGNLKSEFYIPNSANEIIASGATLVSVRSSTGHWLGVANKKNREAAASAMDPTNKNTVYPTTLWNHLS